MALRLIGVPWDQTSPGVKGARLAPEGLRRELATLSPFDPTLGRAAAALRGRDLSLGEETSDLLKEVARVLDQEERRDPESLPLLLGGDQAVAYATLSALHRRYPSLTVVVLDGTLDLEDPPGELTARNWLARAVKDLSIEAVVLGPGRFLGGPEAFHRAEDLGIPWVPSATIRRTPDVSSLPGLRSLLGADRDLYLSLDVSVLDSASAPGCANPNPDGLSPPALVTLLEPLFALPRIRGLDLCEVNPTRDPTGTTVRNAAWLISWMISRLGQDPSAAAP